MTKSCSYLYSNQNASEVCTTFTYDPTWTFQTSVTRPANDEAGTPVTTYYEYDGLGRMTRAVDPLGAVTDYAYDVLGRLTSVKMPDPVTGLPSDTFMTTYTHDDGSNSVPGCAACTLAVQRDPNEFETKTYTDEFGRVRLVEDALGGATVYAYGPHGLTRITDANGNYVAYDYDPCEGKLLKTRSNILGAGETVVEYDYDPVSGRLESIIDRARGTLTALIYDCLDRVRVKKVCGGGYAVSEVDQGCAWRGKTCSGAVFVEMGYDYAGDKLTSVTQTDQDGSRATTYGYDPAWGRLVSVGNPEGLLTYDYYADDRLKTLAYTAHFGSHNTGAYTYNYYPGGAVKTISDGTDTATYQYDPRGLIVGRTSGVAETAYAYDRQGRLAALGHSLGGLPALNYDYGYDAGTGQLGMRTGMTIHPDGNDPGLSYTTTYAYDSLYRLSRVVYPSQPGFPFANQTHMFSYDAIGNRRFMTITSGAEGQTTEYEYAPGASGNSQKLLQVHLPDGPGQIVEYNYNAAGDLLQKTDSSGRTEKFAYDIMGRMIRYHDVGSGPVIQIQYDGNGSRPSVVDIFGWDHFTQRYLYSNEDILMTSMLFPAENPLWDSHIFHGTGIDEPLIQENWNYYENTQQRYHLLTDALGSVVEYFDEYSGASENLQYDAWGSVGGEPPWNMLGPAYGYTGREFLSKDYYFYRARYYEPDIGRFTQRDPMDYFMDEPSAESRPFYVYANNNPISFTDPLGLDATGEAVPVSATGTYNCMAWGIGFTDQWVQPGRPSIIPENTPPNKLPGYYGCKWIKCRQRCECKVEHKVKIYEDSVNPYGWHVQRKDCKEMWTSKNGSSYFYTNIGDPDTFYREHYEPQGRVRMTCWCCPNR